MDHPVSAKDRDLVDEWEAVESLKAPEERELLTAPPQRDTLMDRALERLRVSHLPFRSATQQELHELEDQRLRILEVVSANPALENYYEETWNGITPAAATPHMDVDAVPETRDRFIYRLVAVMQLQLMERAFYLLRLDRFASAPENGGWMDLFRRWGASPRFNAIYAELNRTLSPSFQTFYDNYLANCLPTPPAMPSNRLWQEKDRSDYVGAAVHHPWIAPPGARGRGIFMDSGLVESKLEIDVRSGAGGITDDSGGEGADRTHEKPSDSVDQ